MLYVELNAVSESAPMTIVSKKHEPITQSLITIVNDNHSLKNLLIKSIEKARQTNPDKVSNPAQNLEKYYDFIDWAAKAMPWNVLKNIPRSTVYDKMDQGLTYFYYMIDQPLEELSGKGYFKNSLQYAEPLRTWITLFTKNWGLYLSKKESWNDKFYELVKADDSFGLSQTWYESPSNWKSFNEFFTRQLRTPEERPIASLSDSSIVTSPADSRSQGVFQIDDKSNIVVPGNNKGLLVKSVFLNNIPQLLGEDSEYADKFANGILTHMFLDVNDYHRYHFPIDGVVRHMEIIQDGSFVGGEVGWDASINRYTFNFALPAWQKVQSRAVIILETEKYGIVALLPIGMSQVSSVNFKNSIKIGDTVKKGDKMGYFLFGGSDIVLLFQTEANFELTVPKDKDSDEYSHLLMGSAYGKLSSKGSNLDFVNLNG